MRHLDLFQRAMLDRWRPMPVPTSFLLDQHGRVAVIYKGHIKLERLLNDVALLDDSPCLIAPNSNGLTNLRSHTQK